MRKIFLVAILVLASLLSACGFSKSALDIAKDKFKLVDTVRANSNTDYIFESKQSITKSVSLFKKEKKPNRSSDNVNGKQVLVYDDYFVTFSKSDKDPGKTEIEVASYDFVRNNYRPSFFDGLFTMYLLNHMLGVNNWYQRQGNLCHTSGGCYQGYHRPGGHYKGPNFKPQFRSSPFRGGGPGAGK